MTTPPNTFLVVRRRFCFLRRTSVFRETYSTSGGKDMKKLCCIVSAALFSYLMLCSCGTQGQDSPGTSAPTTSEAGAADDGVQAAASFFPIQTYAVYEVYNGNATGDFDAAMKANPLDAEIQKTCKPKILAAHASNRCFLMTVCSFGRRSLPILLQISSGICPQRKAQNLTRRKQLWNTWAAENG